MRADVYLVSNGHVESRTRASRLISEGKILVDGRRVLKPSEEVNDEIHSVSITETDKYVGRGGLKLEAALLEFSVDISEKKCIDIGASTGGFTDCLLQNGAKCVYAIDAGSGQLHSKLRCDGRVKNIEGFNARELSVKSFGSFDIAVMDVSFISQTLIHQQVSSVLSDRAVFISLIKPQFEAGRSALGKNGIVKNAKDRETAIIKVIESAACHGLRIKGLIKSPIEGGDGNYEYLACFVKNEANAGNYTIDKKYISAICR